MNAILKLLDSYKNDKQDENVVKKILLRILSELKVALDASLLSQISTLLSKPVCHKVTLTCVIVSLFRVKLQEITDEKYYSSISSPFISSVCSILNYIIEKSNCLTFNVQEELFSKTVESALTLFIPLREKSTDLGYIFMKTCSFHVLTLLSCKRLDFSIRREATFLYAKEVIICDRKILQSIVQIHSKLIGDLIKWIPECGDFQLQEALIDIAVYFSSTTPEKTSLIKKWLQNQDFDPAVDSLKLDKLTPSVRVCLNKINSLVKPKKVFTLPCVKCYGNKNISINKPQDEDYTELWVDFNRATQCINLIHAADVEGENWNRFILDFSNIKHFDHSPSRSLIKKSDDEYQFKVVLKEKVRVMTHGKCVDFSFITFVFLKSLDLKDLICEFLVPIFPNLKYFNMSNFKDSESKFHMNKNIDCHKSSSTFGAKAYFNKRSSSSSMSSPSLKQQSIVMKSNDVMKKYINLSTAYRDQNNDSHREVVRISNHNDRLQKSLVNSTINNSGNASGRSSSFVSEIAKPKFDALNKFNNSWNKTESVLPCKEINNNSIFGKFQVSGNGERKNIKLHNTYDLSDQEISGRSLFKFEPRDKENIDISIVPDPSSEDNPIDVLRSAPNLNESTLSSNAPFLGFNESIVFGKGQDRETSLLDENSSASSTDLAPNRPSFIQVYSTALLNNSYLVSDDSIIESSQPMNSGNALGRKCVESCTKDYGNGQFNEKSISVKSYSPTTTHSDEECFQTNKNKTRPKFYVQQREDVILNSKRTDANLPSSKLQEVGDNSGKSSDNMRDSVASKLPLKQYSLVENSITDSLNKEPISSLLPSSECLDKPAKEISTCREYVKETHPKSCGKLFDSTHVLGVSMSNQSGWFNDNASKDSIKKSLSTEKETTIHREHALLKHVDSYLEPNKIPLKKIVKIKQGKKDEINAEQFGKHVACEKAANTNLLESGYKTLHNITEKQPTSPALISGSLQKSPDSFQTCCKDTNVTNCDKNSVPSKKMSEVPPFSIAKFVVPGNSILSSSDISSTKCLMKPVVQITSYNETKSVSGLTCSNSESAFRPISRGLPGYSGTSRAASSLRGTDTSSMMELDQINNYAKGNSRLNPDDSAQRIVSSKDKQKRSQTPYINGSFITADARIVSEPSPSKLSSSKTLDKSHFALVESSESDHNLSLQKCSADKLETKTSNLDLSKLSVPASSESSLNSLFLSPLDEGSEKMNFTRIVNTDANNVTLEDKTNLKKQSNSASFTLPKPSKTYSRNPRIKLDHQWFETCTSKKMNNTGSKSRPIKKKKLFNLRSSYKDSSPISGDSEKKNSVVLLAGTVKQGKSVKETSPALYDFTEPDKDEDKQISNFECFKRNRTVGNFNKIANKNIFCAFNVTSDSSDEEFSAKNEETATMNLRRSARNRRLINYNEVSESDTDKSRASLRNSQDPTKTKIKNSILKNPIITNDHFPSSSCRSFDVTKRKTNLVNSKTQEENLSRKNSKSMQCTKVNKCKTDVTNPNSVFDFTEENNQLPIVKNDNQLNSKLCTNYTSKFNDLRLNAKRGKTQTGHNTLTKSQCQSSHSVEISASKKQVPVSEKTNCINPAQKINNRKTHQQLDTLMNQKNPSDFPTGDSHCSVIEKRSLGKSCENPNKKSVNSLPQVKGQKEQTVVDSDNNFQSAYDLIVGHKNEYAAPASEKRKSSTEPARNFKKVNMGREHLKAIFSSPKVLKERVLNSPSNSKEITVEFSALIHADKASSDKTNFESSNSLAQVSHINEANVIDCGADTNITECHIEMNPISLANDQVGKQCKMNDNAKSEQSILTEALPESQIIKPNEKSPCKRLLSSIKTSINSLTNDLNELHKLLDITDGNH